MIRKKLGSRLRFMNRENHRSVQKFNAVTFTDIRVLSLDILSNFMSH